MERRQFLIRSVAALSSGAGALVSARDAWARTPADVKLEIAPLKLEIAPGKTIQTDAYNGAVPGPLIRWPEGKPIVVEVTNNTPVAETVHWHGLWISSYMDGAPEEGSPMIDPGKVFRYQFTPEPSGFRWYHTHIYAGHDLTRGTYSGQFGCFYIEPKRNEGAYDREIFLVLHDWDAYMDAAGDSSMDAFYKYSTINGRMLGFAEPIQVRQGERVLLHLLNASATEVHWLALAGHEMKIIAMDGNPVPTPRRVQALRLAPAERIDAVVEMDRPGVWIFGETRAPIRKMGMGVVFEYSGQKGRPRWIEPPEVLWSYLPFASSQASQMKPDEEIPLLFQSKFHGPGDFDYWMINGKAYPDTATPILKKGNRYRLKMTNTSTDDHPIHLHRHTFEVTNLDGTPLSGLMKDVVVVPGKTSAEIDFVADNPGATLFHCHQQSHMDFGFMMLYRYA